MRWNYNKLNGKIVEIYGTQKEFSKAMNISEHSISKKLNSKVNWKQQEIQNACRLLKISASDIPKYFFCNDGSEKLNY